MPTDVIWVAKIMQDDELSFPKEFLVANVKFDSWRKKIPEKYPGALGVPDPCTRARLGQLRKIGTLLLGRWSSV